MDKEACKVHAFKTALVHTENCITYGQSPSTKTIKKNYRQWLTTYLRFHFILLVGVNLTISDMESAKSKTYHVWHNIMGIWRIISDIITFEFAWWKEETH